MTADDTTIHLYDLSGKKLADLQGSSPSFSDNPRAILTTSPDEDITRLYDLKGNLLAEYQGSTVSRDDKFRQLSLGFTPGGKQILTLTSDGSLRVWDVDGANGEFGQNRTLSLKVFSCMTYRIL